MSMRTRWLNLFPSQIYYAWDSEFHPGARPEEEYFIYNINTYDWSQGPFINEGYGDRYLTPPDPPEGESTFTIIGWLKDRIPHEPDGHCDRSGVWAQAYKTFNSTKSNIKAWMYLIPSDVPGGQYCKILVNDTEIFSKDGNTFPQGTWQYLDIDFTPTINPTIKLRMYSRTTCYGPFFVGFTDVNVG
jgi:hypothetical protein